MFAINTIYYNNMFFWYIEILFKSLVSQLISNEQYYDNRNLQIKKYFIIPMLICILGITYTSKDSCDDTSNMIFDLALSI